MKRILRNERGIALAVAIFALVVVGALVAGAFFAGTQEQRVGENQRRVQTSFGVAEAGTQERVLTWSPDQITSVRSTATARAAIRSSLGRTSLPRTARVAIPAIAITSARISSCST